MSGALTLATDIWLRMMRQASFRGVAFRYERVTHNFGRRYAMHEYPGRDVPYAEDLGRAQRTWTFTAYVIGDLFHPARMDLMRACEQPGKGSLILPFVGRMDAVCTDLSFDDARDQGRYSAINISFAESGQQKFPSGEEDTHSLIGEAAGDLGTTERDTFLGGFSVGSPLGIGAVAFSLAVTTQAVSTLAGAAAANVELLAAALNDIRLPDAEYDQAPLVAAIDYLNQQAAVLVYDGAELFAAIDTAFAAYTDAHPPETTFKGMLSLAFTFEARQVPVASPQAISTPELRAAELRNAMLFQGLVRRLSLREVSYALPGIGLDNTEDAEQTRRVVFDAFLAEANLAADAGDDAVFESLTRLMHRILDDIDHRAAQLPSLVFYRTERSFNAIALAYQLYGDAERNLDIVARVGAINPAFMPLTGRVLDQ
jgi:prophage DNA circulation protein